MTSELQSAVIGARLVVEAKPFDAIEAAQALHRLAVLVPPHVEPMVYKAGEAIARSITHSESGYDNLARYNLRQLVTALERSFVRAVN